MRLTFKVRHTESVQIRQSKKEDLSYNILYIDDKYLIYSNKNI
jgi:hypothetical protein